MKYLFFFLFIISFTNTYCQITFSNPGFEGVPYAGNPPLTWDICELTPDTQPMQLWQGTIAAKEGLTYLGLMTDSFPSAEYREAAGQFISCNLIAHQQHEFSVWIYEVVSNQTQWHWGGVFQLYAGFSQCELDTFLWQSPILDSVWQQYNVIFTPNKPYRFLTLRANNFLPYVAFNNKHSYIGVDALSSITVQGYNFFSFTNTDTTINKGACVSFTASSDDTAATFYWSTTAGDSVATGDSIIVCPATTTTYICKATLGCGQQFKDSVTVTVLGGGSSGTPILKIPNLLSADNPTWQIVNASSGMQVTIYNTLGQLVYKNKEYNNTLNITTLAAATYFYEVKYGSNTYRGKLMVIR